MALAVAPGPIRVFRDSAWIKVEVAFGNNWNASPLTYTDVTGRIRFSAGVQWNRGRNDEFGEVTPGSFTITFNNKDRAFDPTWVGSPFYPNVDGARPMRITCYYPDPGTAYVQFVGQVEEWDCQWTVGGDAVCVASGTELMGALAFYEMSSFVSLSTTAQGRLTDLLTLAGIPAAQQSFQNGTYQIQTQAYLNVDILSAAQEVAASQNHVFYTTRDGICKTRSILTSSGGPGGTFGELSTELPFHLLDVASGAPYLYTLVKMQPAAPQGGSAPPPVTAKVSQAYIDRYGTRVYSRSVAAVTQANAQLAAKAIAATLAGNTLYRVKQVDVYPMRAPATLWPKVLAADFANGFTFKYQPLDENKVPIGPRFSQPALVQSLAHSVTDQNWSITWMCSPQ